MSEAKTQLAAALRREEAKLLACIHCGLCLEACPTYVHTGNENDSPRGRIYLMRAVEEGRLSADSAAFSRHINRCLGCRACESACPAGVEYGQLLEAARADAEAVRNRRGTVVGRLLHFLLRSVWPYPPRLRLAFAAARVFRDTGLVKLLLKSKLPRLLSPRFEFALALLDSSAPVSFAEAKGDRTARANKESPPPTGDEATAGARADVRVETRAQLFTGCVTEGLFARVNRATRRVLALNSCAVEAPHGQVCCGALHAHAGDLEGARALARRNIEAFGDAPGASIVTNAGGCGAMLAGYAHLLADDLVYAERARSFSARVRDVSQQLQLTGIRDGASLAAATTYDASCHLLHGQRADAEPLAMLRAACGQEFVPLVGSDVCCGGAGVYNLLQPELSGRVLREKLKQIGATGAHLLATGNPGCHMQIGAGAQLTGVALRVCHPVELLDESYRRAGLYERHDARDATDAA